MFYNYQVLSESINFSFKIAKMGIFGSIQIDRTVLFGNSKGRPTRANGWPHTAWVPTSLEPAACNNLQYKRKGIDS